MSQHHFPSLIEQQKVWICAGWDRNTGAFFLRITDDEDELIQLADGFTTAALVQHAARTFGCQVPQSIAERLLQDGEQNAGNEVAFYDRNGLPVATEQYTHAKD